VADYKEYNNNFSSHEDVHARSDISKSRGKNGKLRKVIINCLTVLMLVSFGMVSACSSTGFSSQDTQVTVTFDSMGGSEVGSVTVPKGEELLKVDTPSRSGYVFAGWYYEKAPVNEFKEGDVFSQNTTLYAGWYEPVIEVDNAEYIGDCDSGISFVVSSETELTNANLSDYIEFSNAGFEDGKTLSVKWQTDGYLLYAEGGFTPGNTYSIALLDTRTVSFVKAGDNDVTGQGITSYNFTVHKENINNVKLKVTPKDLSSSDVAEFEVMGEVVAGETDNAKDNGKTIHRLLMTDSNADFKVGDMITLGPGESNDPTSQYYKIIKVEKNNSGLYLYLVTPDMDELYSDFELYYTGDAVYFEEDYNSEELERNLQTALRKSEGYYFLASTIATSIMSSPTLRRTVAGFDAQTQKRYENLSVSNLTDLLMNVNFDIEFGKTKDIANNDNGVYGRIKFSTDDIDIDLAEGLKLTINLTMSEDITATAYGWFKLDGTDFYIDNGSYFYNQFDMSFSAVIATDSGTINITEEIQNLIDSTSDDKTQLIVDNLNKENLFGEDLDYVEVLSKELGNKTISIYEVLTVQFALDFKVSLGMRVSLDMNFSSAEMRKIGMSNIDYSAGSLKASKTDMKYTNQRLKTELQFSAEVKGKIGVRAGFEAGVNFSFVHLNDVLNFGFDAEVGVYEEISGYLRFEYNYANTAGKDPTSNMSLAGGRMNETGIYVELSFTWDLFTWEDSITTAEFKFPILTIGALEFASEFENGNSAITFDTTSYNIKNGNSDLLKLKYIDISGGDDGVTINVKLPAAKDEYAFFLAQDKTGKGGQDDLKYVSVDRNTGMVTVAENAPERLDFTVVAQYTKGSSLFSQDLAMITKNINFTYMKYKVENSSQKYKATFYMPDGSVLEQKEYYVGQTPVPPSLEYLAIGGSSTPYNMKDWSKPWKEEIKPLYADTDYHMDTEPNLRNVTFYGYVYNEATGRYYWGDIAVVSSLVGELPIPPMFEVEKNTVPGWVFYKWDPSLNIVTSDDAYSAWYSQDTGMTWTNFYVDGKLIATKNVSKGDMPVPPDMSAYNTGERQFTGWWPKLHTTDDNFEYYYAEFTGYVNITFKDRDGKVLSTQRILSGETPTAPEVPAAFEGEEDYFEYRFGGWQADDGAMMGRATNDRVYSPIYNKTYLEVTTVFDADGHTFKDGKTTKVFKGAYKSNVIYMPGISYRDKEYYYEVDYWQSTEKQNGEYVKLRMSDVRADYKYNLTFTPVFKIKERITYTVVFYSRSARLALNGRFGDVITQDMLSGIARHETVGNYIYNLTDYGLELPYSFGTVTGADGLPAEYLTVNALYSSTGVSKTFTFNANGGKFDDNSTVKTVTAPYGSAASFPDTPVKADDAEYSYTFIGWAYEPDATSGRSFDSFIINGDSTLYAVYSRTPLLATLVFNASPGHFADGSAQKEVHVAIGGTAPMFSETPVRDLTANYEYTFTGWDPAYPPGTPVTSDMRFEAQYSSQDREYTVTFDAGDGEFSDGESTLIQTYHYDDTIVPPDDPERTGGVGYEYVFDGWPGLTPGMTVSFNHTFAAAYHLVGTGGLEETGIIVSDGVTSEDINVGSIDGYTYEMIDYLGAPVPMLTVTGDGLTFSGTSDSVYITIAGSVSEVTFRDLALDGSYGAGDAVLSAGEGTGTLTINVEGDCVLRNTADAHSLYLDRAVKLNGEGSDAALSIAAPGSSETIYASGNLEVKNLEMNVTSVSGHLIFGDVAEGEERVLTLDNAHFTASGPYGIQFGTIVIKGAANVSFTANDPESLAALIAQTLSFEGDTGKFYVIAADGHPAVIAETSITFDVPDNYNLHGAEVKLETIDDGYGNEIAFYTFVKEGTILSEVTVEGN